LSAPGYVVKIKNGSPYKNITAHKIKTTADAMPVTLRFFKAPSTIKKPVNKKT
jgi:hypothetical protein